MDDFDYNSLDEFDYNSYQDDYDGNSLDDSGCHSFDDSEFDSLDDSGFNSFEEFIESMESMELPALPHNSPIPILLEELMDIPAEAAHRIRAAIGHRVEKYMGQSPREWISELTILQVVIRDVILRTVAPDPKQLMQLSYDEIVGNTAYTFMTLALLILNEMNEMDDWTKPPLE